ncbi:hypothetical protein GGR53DRAFT_462863 [Hypoxylon sp. FL1150]|nr:hypothetical protein GGR53DRAFT_462863 [Hypoxylon sp. FL1150]
MVASPIGLPRAAQGIRLLDDDGPDISAFNLLYPEKVALVQVRLNNEFKRHLGVLNGVLEGKRWLTGEWVTYDDLSFVLWNETLHQCIPMSAEDRLKKFPNVRAWHERMTPRQF